MRPTRRAATIRRTARVLQGAFAGAASLLLLSSAGLAQLAGQKVEELEGVGIDQHLEALLPLDARFTDAPGEVIELGALFDGELPLLLTLNYVDCPQLCSLQLATLVQAINDVELDLGRDYRIVTVSIQPADTPERAAAMRDRYLDSYTAAEIEPEARATAWHFLVGDQLEIDRVAETVGFNYRWLPDQQEYAHPAATIVCTPEGRVARYLEGIRPEPATVRLSLVEASEGKIGSLFDGIFLSCFMYDGTKGSYVPSAFKIMRIGGALVLLAIVTGIFFLRRSEIAEARAREAEAD